MKGKLTVLFAVFCLCAAVLCWLGIGCVSSSSAVQDLKTELETIYGPEYTRKNVDHGVEDMVFVVEPKTWFLTNWNLRNALGMDYQYECNIIFTTYVDGSVKRVRTITYQATDPMGKGDAYKRAFLDLDSRVETTENK